MHNARFLIADDSPVTRLVVTSIIKDRFGSSNIFAVTDGQSAIEVLETQKIDFIIADWAMPNLSGENFLTMLKKSRLTRGIPIIVLSSRHDNVSTERVLALGASQHIVKPFQPELLEEKVMASWNPADKRRARRYASLPQNRADLRLGKTGINPVHVINISQTGILFRMEYGGELRLFESCRLMMNLELGDGSSPLSIDPLSGQCIRMSADDCEGGAAAGCAIARARGGCPSERKGLAAVALHFEEEKVPASARAEIDRLIRWLEANAPSIVGEK